MSPLQPDQVLSGGHQLAPFPGVVLEILGVLEDEGANLHRLIDHVRQDPVLASRILSLANSAQLHQAPQRGGLDLFNAVSMLGLARVQSLVTTYELGRAYGTTPAIMADSHYWRHSIDVGVAGRVLAEHHDIPPDPVYLSGLMHDIGQLWLATAMPVEYGRLQARLEESDQTVNTLELETFGMDHGRVGGLLAVAWGLPEPVQEAIRWHHGPAEGDSSAVTAAVHLAEIIANALNLADRPRNRVDAISEAALRQLPLGWDGLPDLFGEIQARTRHMHHISGLQAR